MTAFFLLLIVYCFHFKGLGFGTIDKIYLEFTEPWWSSTDRGFSFLWSEEDKSNFTFPEDGSKVRNKQFKIF